MSHPFDWPAALAARPDSSDLQVVAELGVAPQGHAGANGSRPVRASDGRTWWVKPVPGAHGYAAAVAELVVSGCGEHIGAPVCETRVIGSAWAYLEDGTDELCTASLDVAQPLYSRSLEHRTEDDNRSRQAGVYALWDWLIGADPQWLYASSGENETFSHDHGLWLPSSTSWPTATLTSWVDADPHWPPGAQGGLSRKALNELADALDSLSVTDVAEVLARVPSTWDIDNVRLERLGVFVFKRAAVVATHLRDLGRSV